jgi:hypothetical protein
MICKTIRYTFLYMCNNLHFFIIGVFSLFFLGQNKSAYVYLCVVYLTTFFSNSDYIASNKRKISKCIGKGLEGGGRGLIQGTTSAFAKSDREKPRKTSVGIAGLRAKI